MPVRFVAYHYPHPDHFADFVARTRKVREVLLSQPGCESAEIWVTAEHDAVVTTGRFDSEADYRKSFAAAAALGDVVAFDDREHKPREITTLVEP